MAHAGPLASQVALWHRTDTHHSPVSCVWKGNRKSWLPATCREQENAFGLRAYICHSQLDLMAQYHVLQDHHTIVASPTFPGTTGILPGML